MKFAARVATARYSPFTRSDGSPTSTPINAANATARGIATIGMIPAGTLPANTLSKIVTP